MKSKTKLFASSAVLLTLFSGCKREERVFDPGTSGTQVADGVSLNEVHAGGRCLHRTRANMKRAHTPSPKANASIWPTTAWVVTRTEAAQ